MVNQTCILYFNSMNINVIYLHTFCCMYTMFNRAFEDKTIRIDLYILVCFKMIKTILKSCDEKGCENDLDILRLKITSCFYNLSRMYCKILSLIYQPRLWKNSFNYCLCLSTIDKGWVLVKFFIGEKVENLHACQCSDTHT